MKSKVLFLILVMSFVFMLTGVSLAQLPVGVPRSETLIVDQIFRYSVSNNFNLWNPAGGSTPTRQSLCFDTLWYLDQQTGAWINSLAKEKPIYNDDYTEMTVNLREGIYWSDGVEFTADDVVFTVRTLKDNPGMMWSSDFKIYVDSVEKVDKYTVKFNLTEPNNRFHYIFTARYNACFIMPEHIWKDVKKPMEFDFYPVVSLGAYVQQDQDQAGYWELFKLRDDWERATPGKITGKPGPKYVLTLFYGPSEKKVMAMASHDLDLFMNVDYEAFRVLLKQDEYARSWYKDFPWAWPDELDTRFFGFNLENELSIYSDKDIRWALTLALNGVELQTEYIGGVTRITPIPQPSTPLLMKLYHKPLEPWLKDFEIEVTEGEYFKPYDDEVPRKIAEWAVRQGYEVPQNDEAFEQMFGIGWWKYAPEIAEKLLKKHGFTRNDEGQWLKPDGSKWTISILATPDEVDVYRLALGAVDQWGDFGIDAKINTMERDPYYILRDTGDYDCFSSWGDAAQLCNAIDDKWPYMYPYHSDFYVPTGKGTTLNRIRLKSEKIDKIIEELGALAPDDPRSRELEYEFFKEWVRNQYSITTISFKKFITEDEYYWTNFPNSENPYGQPSYWFMGSRFVLPHLEKTGK